jgi:hypothetical protein
LGGVEDQFPGSGAAGDGAIAKEAMGTEDSREAIGEPRHRQAMDIGGRGWLT